jgi:hypothetical protein
MSTEKQLTIQEVNKREQPRYRWQDVPVVLTFQEI